MIFRQAHRGEPVFLILCIGGLRLLCYMMELDEKYASVILRRYVEDTGNAEGVYVIRNGQRISYAELVKEVETKEA